MSKYKKNSKFSLDSKIENSNFDFCKNLKWFLIAPIIIILVGVVLLCSVGFNLGIDFTGGTNMTIFIDSEGTYSSQSYDVDEDFSEISSIINSVLKKHGLSASSIQKIEISESSDENVALGIVGSDAVIVKYQNDSSLDSDQIAEVNDEIRLELLKAFGFVENDDSVTLESLEGESVLALVSKGEVTSASVTTEIIMRSVVAIIVALALVLVYIIFRFNFLSSLPALLVLFHDFAVTLSVMLICRVQINITFVAALIVAMVYSLYNTIVLYGHIRDEVKMAQNNDKKIDNVTIANTSVKSTMLRSVLTSSIAVVLVLMLIIIGVSGVREFAFPIIVGILVSFYSSTFITPGLWAVVYKHKKRNKIKSKKEKKNESVVEVETVTD